MPSLPAISNFPATLDDVISLAEFMDLASTTLADPAVTASSTTFNSPDTSRFSATGIFTIEGEHVRYTGKTSTSFTGCTRGVFQTLGGFAPAPHPAGAVIEQLNIAALHAVLRDAVIAAETKVGSGASTPTSGKLLTGGVTAGTSSWQSPAAITSGQIATALGYTPADVADTGDDVEGPSASTDGEVPLYSGTTGKLLKRSNTLTGFLQLASGVASAAALTLSQITTALGFTPVNKAGDSMSGALTSTVAASGVGLDMSTNDVYADMRVIRNARNAGDKVLYLGYGAGAAGAVWLYNNTTRKLGVDSSGVTIDTLAGTGSRMVEASAAGVLSAAKIPGMDLLAQTAAGATTIDFNNVLSATYDDYLLLATIAVLPVSAEFYMRFGNAGVDDVGASDYRTHLNRTNSGTTVAFSSLSTVIYLGPGGGGLTWQYIGLNAWLLGMTSGGANQARCNFHYGGVLGGSDWHTTVGTGFRQSLGRTFTDVSIFSSSGGFSACQARLYGMRK